MNSIDPRRLVSHEGDVEEATREYEASKNADAAKKKATTDDAPKTADGDKSKTASGVSYAEYAKNAQQSAPACTSDKRENCPSDGPTGQIKIIKDIGTRGVELTIAKPNDDTKVGVYRVQGGLQNELSVTSVTQQSKVAEHQGTSLSIVQTGPAVGAHAGFHNPDGSTGVNFGAHADAVSTGVHVDDTSGATLDAQVSEGASIGGSIGLREKNGTQICASAEIGPVTVGGCLPLTHRN